MNLKLTECSEDEIHSVSTNPKIGRGEMGPVAHKKLEGVFQVSEAHD